jgi:hypothetical protein
MKIGAKQDVPVELRLARAVCPNRVDGNPKANLVLRFGQLPRIGASSKPARKESLRTRRDRTPVSRARPTDRRKLDQAVVAECSATRVGRQQDHPHLPF